MVKVRRHKIELTGEVGQSKRNLKNSNQKDAFKIKNEANARTIIILNNQKYFYEKCNRVIKNVIGDRHANVNRAQPAVRGKRLIPGHNERNGDHKRNKRLDENPVKHADQFQILRSGRKMNKVIKQVSEANRGPVTIKKEVKEEGQKGKSNEKNSTEKIEKNNDDDTSTEVEILDSDEVIKKGISSAFVPSITYISDFGVSKASSDYRERVLNVLKKPFDKEEFRRLSEEVKIYLAKYPDLKRKLNEYRYKGLTRMTILRGFFFWLQNVMHDEAFQPWEDSQCLAVQPGSGQEN